MSNIDIDALMSRAFNLPAPPRPVLPKHGEAGSESATTQANAGGNLVVLGDTPSMDGPRLLSDDDLETLAAAGQPGLLGQQGQGPPLADAVSPNRKNRP